MLYFPLLLSLTLSPLCSLCPFSLPVRSGPVAVFLVGTTIMCFDTVGSPAVLLSLSCKKTPRVITPPAEWQHSDTQNCKSPPPPLSSSSGSKKSCLNFLKVQWVQIASRIVEASGMPLWFVVCEMAVFC